MKLNRQLIIALTLFGTIIIGGVVVWSILHVFDIPIDFLFPTLAILGIVSYLLVFRIDWLMYLLAFSTPFSIVLESDKIQLGISLPAELLMLLVTFLFFCRICYDLSLRRELIRHPISIAIYTYLGWMLFTCFTSELPLVSFKFFAAKIWFITSSYWMVIQLIDKDIKKWMIFFDCYAVALAIVVAITTFRYVQNGFDKNMAHWIMAPFYNDHTAYGAVLSLFIPIMFGRLLLPKESISSKIFHTVLLILFLIGLYLSFSRAAWLGLVGAFVVYIIIKLKISFKWLTICFVIVGALLWGFSNEIIYSLSRNNQDSSTQFMQHLQSISNISTDASNVERINRWQAAFGMIAERPIVGWGPGTYQFCYAPFQDYRYQTIISTNFGNRGNAHSEFIGPCAESGIIGLLTVLFLLITVIYSGLKIYHTNPESHIRILALSATLALLTYYIHGIMNNFLDTDKLSLPFWGLFALIVVLDTQQNSLKFKSNDLKIK